VWLTALLLSILLIQGRYSDIKAHNTQRSFEQQVDISPSLSPPYTDI
jgi:hypothetical protein